MAALRGDISFRYLKQFLLVKYDLFVYQSLLQCNWGSCERMAFLEFDNILVLYSLSASEISYNAYIFDWSSNQIIASSERVNILLSTPIKDIKTKFCIWYHSIHNNLNHLYLIMFTAIKTYQNICISWLA
jgi:hypothetical protein